MKRCPDCDMDARICRELGGCQVEERDPNAAFHAEVLRALGIEEDCAVDGCNHGNCEEAARQDAKRERAMEREYDRREDAGRDR